jgi:DNA-binding CsgD family transcriptional regulator
MYAPSAEGTLVERDRPMQRLRDLYTECTNFHCQVTVISGPVGCGKTALLSRFCDWAAQCGAIVLNATASRSERQLPLGVVDQLGYSGNRLGAARRHISRIRSDVMADSWHSAMLGHDEEQRAVALRTLSSSLLELADLAPLVIAIDDVHLADGPSQLCMASLLLRLRGSRAMLLLTDSGEEPDAQIDAEWRRGRHIRPVEVGPLSPQAVARLLARHEGLDQPGLAARAHALTGGNPLLVRALIGDSLPADGRLRPGPAFAEAFRACLHRSGPDMLRVAQGLAVLGERVAADRAGRAQGAAYPGHDASGEPQHPHRPEEPGGPDGLPGSPAPADGGGGFLFDPADERRSRPSTLYRLLDMAGETAERAIGLLDRARLLEQRAFRHPAAHAAVIAGMEPAEYAALHAAAARIRHRAGDPPITVSLHLLRSGRIEGEGNVSILLDAAEQALDGGLTDHALACLQAARAACGDADERTQARVTSILARAAWWMDPADLLGHLPELAAAEQAGKLTARQRASLALGLLWHNRLEPAMDVLARLVAQGPAPGGAADGLDNAMLWARYAYPGLAGRVEGYQDRLAQAGARPDPQSPATLAGQALTAATAQGPLEGAVAQAEQALHHLRFGEYALAPAVVALNVLLLADRAEAAAYWCDSLLAGDSTAKTPIWQAVLLALHAETAVLTGDLRLAQAQALKALSRISLPGWGPAVGGVLATLVHTAVEFEQFETAADFLRAPLPGGMMETPFGLKYVHARGMYYLAAGRVGDALIDFRLCGGMAGDFGFDQPGLVPWRTSLARVHLARQNPDEAERLVREQLKLLSPGQNRLRGICLRTLAAAADPKNRVTMLREALELLKPSGDLLETARAYADMGDALKRGGEVGRARLAIRASRGIAERCHATALLRRLGPGTTVARPGGPTPPDLSEAERRVAGLAALGHTNPQIAASLCVTISTVEQHLTRVYRKLGISRRTDLPRDLSI